MRLRLIVAIFLCTLPVFAQPPIPKVREGGEYWIRNEDTWLDWEVTTAELAGRLTPLWPLDDEAPEALLSIDWLVPRWPVVATFRQGQRLQAVPDEGGGILIKDIDGGTWMRVRTPNGGFCFVRALGKYLRPVAAPVATPPTPPIVTPTDAESVPED